MVFIFVFAKIRSRAFFTCFSVSPILAAVAANEYPSFETNNRSAGIAKIVVGDVLAAQESKKQSF